MQLPERLSALRTHRVPLMHGNRLITHALCACALSQSRSPVRQQLRQHPLEMCVLAPDEPIALAGGLFQAPAVENRDTAALIPDQTLRLKLASRHGNAGP